MTIQDISLRKLSGRKGSSSSDSVTQTRDSLYSTDIVEALLGISEGPIAGLENGAKSYLIGETHLQDDTGTNNFENFELVDYKGSELGEDIFSRLGGFGASTTVNTEMAPNVSIIREGQHTLIDYLDVRFAINALYVQNQKGSFENTGRWRIEYKLKSEDFWTPVRTATNNPLPPQISGTNFDVFYGDEGTFTNIAASPGDRPTYWTSAQPITTANAGIWFDTSNNYKPKIWDGSNWYFPTNLSFANNIWTWLEASPWGGDKTTRGYVGPSLGMSPNQGDYWLNTAAARPYFFNGSAWIQAGSSLRPGTFGENGTGGTVTITAGEIAITAKTTSPFAKEFRIPVPQANEPYMIRVTKTSPIDTTESFFSITWESFQEVTAKSYKFPGLACTQVIARASEQFSSIPDLSGVYLGRIVRVPTNYDSVSRTYTGLWDGTWKLAYTNNAALVAYDLVQNDRYGMNAYYPITLNKDDVYQAAVWCDTRTASGQPRFTFNGLISDPKGGRDAINYICGIFAGRFFDDGNGQGAIRIDRDDSPALIFTPENIVDGIFTYSFTEISTRHNDLTVSFINPDLGWQTDRRRVYDQDHINQYGRIPDNFEAVGCTSEEEAIRRARYALITGTKETMMVNFKTNRQGLYMSPYDVILVSDADMETGLTGRVKRVSGPRTIDLRDPLFLEPGFSYKISFTLISEATSDFIIHEVDLTTATGALTQLVTTEDLPELPEFAVFTISQVNGDAAPMAFRVMSITENDTSDNVDISAVQMNRAKWLYIDGYVDTIADLDKYVLDVKKKPEPIQNLRVSSSIRQNGLSTVTTLALDWDPSPTKTVSRYRIEGSRDNGPMSTLGDTPITQFEWDDIPAGEYYFQVFAVDINGYESKPAVIEHRMIGDTRVLDDVTSLRMVDEPSDTIFESRSPTFQWGASKDQYFAEYVVQIRTPDDVVIREEHITNTYYMYEYTVNANDGGGKPRRQFKFCVASRDQYGFLSDYTTVTVNNPAPEAPATQSVEVLYDAAVVHYEVPNIRDFRGVVIHASTTDNFTPSAATQVYKGPNNNVALPLTGGAKYYFKIALYDLFEDSDLIFGNQMSLDVPIPGGGADVTPPMPPTGLKVTSGFKLLTAEWTKSTDTDLAYVELFTSIVDNVSTAKLAATFAGESGVIPNLIPDQVVYVWARSVDMAGNHSDFTTSVNGKAIGLQSTDIPPGTIVTEALAAGAITAEKIGASEVTAAKMDVDKLSAISSNLGDITGGSLNINNKFMVDASGNVTVRSAATGARLQITNQLVQVYDGNGVERVRLGVW